MLGATDALEGAQTTHLKLAPSRLWAVECQIAVGEKVSVRIDSTPGAKKTYADDKYIFHLVSIRV